MLTHNTSLLSGSDSSNLSIYFFCFQICGKVFTKTYNLTVHMRMHQDIRPFPCTVCEQTFRQKAHLQRHEATHGIDSMANRKRRKRPLDENGLEPSDGSGDAGKIGIMEGEEEEEDDDIAYRPFVEKRKFTPAAVMKTERDEEGGETDLDPMIEPIVRQQQGSGSSTQDTAEKRLLCVPVNVGTNTEARQHHVLNDEIEESTLEPVRFREAAPLPPRLIQVEQGVQYCAEDLLQDEDEEVDPYGRHPDQDVKYSGVGGDDSRINGMGTNTDEGAASLRDERQGLKCENVEEEGEGGVCHMDDSAAMADEGVVTYSSQEEETHYHVTTVEGEDGQQQLIAQTADGSYIDASGSQLVMSADGELVGFVPLDNSGGGGAQQHSSQVVNISTSTNEHGQQVVIIENLHAHSPELQQEILRALMSDTNLIPLSQA
jgi:hypothetical protein